MTEEQYVSRDQHLAELRPELKEAIAGIRQDVAVLSKSVEHLAQIVSEMRTHMERQFTEFRQELRDIRTATQRQMWVLIAVVVVTMFGGMVKLVSFP